MTENSNLKNQFEDNILLKSKLLVQGCNVHENFKLPNGIRKKKIHLYAHSRFKVTQDIPDDVIIGEKENACIVRIRFDPTSPLELFNINHSSYIRDLNNNSIIPVTLINRSNSEGTILEKHKISTESVCSFLGTDLLGITPSNHCFYFKKNEECRFCEIWGNYKSDVKYKKAVKSADIIADSIDSVLSKDSTTRHLAITSGNIKNYDFTTEYFCKIGEKLKRKFLFEKFQDVLATLMPPDNIELIPKLKSAGFNKVYFPLEVFDKSLFKIICPGKQRYGYEKILNALDVALTAFGKGNVYTNFVYGIQSLDPSLKPNSYNPLIENEISLESARSILSKDIVPVYTIYHYSGYNQIGHIPLSTKHTFDFFKQLGEIQIKFNVISKKYETIIFDPLSLSNTLYNESYRLAKSIKLNAFS